MKHRTGPRSADQASILQAALVQGRLFKFKSCSALNRGPLRKKKIDHPESDAFWNAKVCSRRIELGSGRFFGSRLTPKGNPALVTLAAGSGLKRKKAKNARSLCLSVLAGERESVCVFVLREGE